MASVKELSSLDVAGKRVILRADLNVPLKDGEITDDGRIRASLPTIDYLISAGASILIVAHLGRPKGERKRELSLKPVASRLQKLLGRDVAFAETIDQAVKFTERAQPGEITCLENIRFESAETSKDENERLVLAKKLAQLGELYVGDGFGAVHRKHASVFELASILPHAAGYLVAKESEVLEKLATNPLRPYGVVLGGAKVSDKIGVINNLLERVEMIAIGGGMVFTFLAAKGYAIGKSLFESDQLDVVKSILLRAKEKGVEVLLPTDIKVAGEFKDVSARIVGIEGIGENDLGLDIGPQSADAFAEAIKKCRTIFWNGPMGVFEFSNFREGTRVVAEALRHVDGLAVVGGGDSAAAIRALGFADSDFGYVSTGGGASLEYLEGKELPGLVALS